MTFIHKSFHDFITSQQCPDKRLIVHLSSYHQHLWKRAFAELSKHFDAKDYDESILRYACQYWPTHCLRSNPGPSELAKMDTFIHDHLVRWLKLAVELQMNSLVLQEILEKHVYEVALETKNEETRIRVEQAITTLSLDDKLDDHTLKERIITLEKLKAPTTVIGRQEKAYDIYISYALV